MPILTAPGIDKDPTMEHVYGNLSVKRKRYTIPSGAKIADIVRFMVLPKNIRILDFFETHNGDNSTATTANFGLKRVDAVGTLDDPDYFLAAADLNAAGRNRWGNTAVYSVLLDADYYVQAVLAGADTGAAMDVEVTVYYEFVGNL